MTSFRVVQNIIEYLLFYGEGNHLSAASKTVDKRVNNFLYGVLNNVINSEKFS
jgi:hypothetical protein